MMRSIRGRLLVGLLLLVAVMSVITGAITYRRVLGETSNLFDYQLRQMALSLGDQASFMSGYTLPAHPENSDFVIQIWDVFGTRIYSPGLPFLDKAIRVTFDALNLTNSPLRTTFGYENAPYSTYYPGREYLVGVRATF